jgi:hypothetical protein
MIGWIGGGPVALVFWNLSLVTHHSSLFLSYRAIYRVGDSRVGQWSKPVSVTVGG